MVLEVAQMGISSCPESSISKNPNRHWAKNNGGSTLRNLKLGAEPSWVKGSVPRETFLELNRNTVLYHLLNRTDTFYLFIHLFEISGNSPWNGRPTTLIIKRTINWQGAAGPGRISIQHHRVFAAGEFLNYLRCSFSDQKNVSQCLYIFQVS